jgi:transcriptional regulator of acetoin/glycerol metabolism
MKYPISHAAKIVGVTRQTLYRHIKSKAISTETDDTGTQVIDASELIRVYGDKLNFEISDKDTTVTRTRNSDSTDDLSVEERIEVAKLESEIIRLKDLLHRTESENDYIKSLLAEERTERKKANNLLEDMRTKQAPQNNWERAMRVMEQRISNQDQMYRERIQKEKKLQMQNQVLKHELEAEKSKKFWKRLFG